MSAAEAAQTYLDDLARGLVKPKDKPTAFQHGLIATLIAENKALASRLHSCELQRDEWKQYADNGLKSYSEQQAEIASLSSRLQYFHERSIQRGVSGCSCRICQGAWAHDRPGGELHEQWCPNYPATHHTVVVEKQEPK